MNARTRSSRDIYGTIDQIKQVRKQAESLLEDGELQKARHLILGLRREIMISIDGRPLRTLSRAIVNVTPLIETRSIEARGSFGWHEAGLQKV